MDAAHSHVGFKVRHMMVSWVRGEFGKTSANVTTKDGELTAIEATIDVSSIDTENAKRDEHLRSSDFFDSAKHPNITFKSTKVTGTGGDYQVFGDLTMRGVTKPVTLAVTGFASGFKDPWGNTKAGASATVKIDRQDWGVSWSKSLDGGGVVVGDEVTIELEIELNQQ